MQEFILRNFEVIFSFITIFVTWFFGFVIKNKTHLNNKLIPVQNVIIMIISSLIYFYATGDLSTVVLSSSPIATLFYDTFHVFRKE